jgi:hypothetical protein
VITSLKRQADLIRDNTDVDDDGIGTSAVDVAKTSVTAAVIESSFYDQHTSQLDIIHFM